jgi:hypothetical protein
MFGTVSTAVRRVALFFELGAGVGEGKVGGALFRGGVQTTMTTAMSAHSLVPFELIARTRE